ncbi:Homeobox and CUT domain containing protein [Trichuris trichiura]|uniref:One cut domain family member n=1 Tax=Trichuris trichiura TaxID=36087 RepID=A0A077ZAU9_TRITR|nr:Homeobox and CUT domain containing protein [Trichuris trichiura]
MAMFQLGCRFRKFKRSLPKSQGTLSDLLRNPKPWNVLKSGRETFRRMYNWLQLPLVARMQMFDSSSSSSEENQNDVTTTTTTTSSSASNKEPTSPTKAKAAGSGERQCRVSSTFVSEEDLADARARLTKKRRLVFSESQKKALNAVFRVKPRPSRRIQEVVARCLDLSRSTVQNFFMNARRRSRPNGQLIDQPLSHQVVRPISPPPPLPKGPVREPSTRRQGNNSSNNISSSNAGTATAGGHSTDEAATTDDEFDPLVLLVLEMVRSEEDRLAGENPLSTATSAAASPLNDSA